MHVHDSIVGQMIRRLRGKDDVARKRPEQDVKRVHKGKEPLGPITDLRRHGSSRSAAIRSAKSG